MATRESMKPGMLVRFVAISPAEKDWAGAVTWMFPPPGTSKEPTFDVCNAFENRHYHSRALEVLK